MSWNGGHCNAERRPLGSDQGRRMPEANARLAAFRPGCTFGRARPLPAGYRPLNKGHIDMGTGLYVREGEDLALPGRPSFVLRRTYRTRDSRSRAFGIGGSHTGDWFLVGDSRTFQWADVILEDGGRIHYERTSSGTGISNARYKHRATPSSF